MKYATLLAVFLAVACQSKKSKMIKTRDGVTVSCPYTACVYVSNDCGVTLYLDRTSIDDSNGVVNSVTAVESGSYAVLDISAWGSISAGQRLYAWWKDPTENSGLSSVLYADKVEINYCSTSPITMCYNPTAVDYFALPVEIGPLENGTCNVPQTGTPNIKLSSIKTKCPTTYVSTAPLGVCKSPGSACASDSSLDICSALDSTIDECISDGVCDSDSTTSDAYGCSNWFSDQPGYCAAINRGVYPSLSQDDASQFYVNSPYNAYAAYIHTNDEPEYAFPYDDYGSSGQSGYQVCTTNFLSVKWCPSG